MHPIELAIAKFLGDVKKRRDYVPPQHLLEKFSTETREALLKQFSDRDNNFTLRMSNIGKPLCMLQMEKQHGSDGIQVIRALLGDLVEDVALFLIHASGLKVVAELLPVELEIAGTKIKGTLDIVLNINGEDQVFDIKSCSDYAFKKYTNASFEDFVANDTFGYVTQLFGYSKAVNKQPAGWIFVNKSSGEIKVLVVPSNWQEYQQKALKDIEDKIKNIDSSFKRSFEDFPEFFKRKATGNRVLGIACSFCDHKFKCWDNLKVLPALNSVSKNPAIKYYTVIGDRK